MSGKMASGKDFSAEVISETFEENDSNIRLLFASFTAELRRELDLIAEEMKMNFTAEELSSRHQCSIDDMNKLRDIFKADSDFYRSDYTLFNRNEKSRELLQFWGTEVRRKQSNDYWVRKAREFVAKVSNRYDYIFFTDVRFPNEAQGIKDMGGILIRCESPESLRIERLESRGIATSQESLNHASETSLDEYDKFDYLLTTINREDAEQLAIKLMSDTRGLSGD